MKFTNQSKVLVTGACGFIGSHLVERLVESGCQVKVLVRYNSNNSWGNLEELSPNILKSIEVVTGNIQDSFLVRKAVKGSDVVFHLAALIGIPYSFISPSSYIETNLQGTFNVLQACLDEGVSKIVYASTSEVYGTGQYTPIDEKHPLQAQSPYAATKIAGDKLAESYYYSFQLPVAIARPFNTFGPRQSARAIIPSVISQICSGQKTLRLGLLTPVRDFTYVKDMVEAFVALAESDQVLGQAVNVGSGKGVTISEVVHEIINAMDSNVEIVCDEERMRPVRSEVQALVCNNSKIKALTGWAPRYSLQDGLKDTIEYIERHINQYKVGVYNR